MTDPNSPLVVVVSGGGPVGLTFSLNLAMMMGRHAKIIIYEARWFVDESGVTRWQGEDQGKTRRDQVVTLQDHVIQQLPVHIQKGLFRNIDEQVWPTSRNIPIREVEDRLFELIYPFVQHGQIELVPEQLQEQSDILIKGDFDVLVGADGSNSFVRRYCNIQMISEGLEYACGVAYNIPKEVAPADEPLHQALNCILTVSQTRYLVNSSNSRRGYLNIRLIQSEYEELRERLLAFQSRNEALDLMDYDKCPQSPAWSIIRQGLDFFRIAPKFVFRVVPIEINVRHASIVVREMRFQVEEPSTEVDKKPKKQFKTALAFLVGDAALNVHFWPGRGMNSGMKGAMALARNIVRSCLMKDAPYTIQPRKPLRFLDFLDYEGFMARLRAREQQGRSLRVLIDPIDKSVEASYSYAHLSHCYAKYTHKLKEKLKDTRQRLQERPEWPHQSRPVTDDELNTACNRISSSAVAQLSLANPWPTREMGGVEILVQDTFPYDPANFLPVPALLKKMLTNMPSVLIRRRYISLWVVGESTTDHVEKLIADTRVAMRDNADVQLNVVNTIKEAVSWIVSNRQAIRQAGTLFKVVTAWSLSASTNAVDVIRAVRGEEPRVPVLIYTNRHEETQPALEFPNVSATDLVFDLYEFIGINQETQWNGGCRAVQSAGLAGK